MVQKPALGAQGPIDSAFFDDLGELEKSPFFGNRSGSQKNLKIGPRVARRRQTRPRVFAEGGGSCRPGPQGGHARDQKVERGQLARGKKDQRERRQVEKWKKGKVGKGK